MIEEYLTEESTGIFLKERFRDYTVSSPTLKFNGKRFLPDFLIEELKLIVEYDGPRHYTQPTTVIRDIVRNQVFEENGYNVIHIPYFIQLDEQIIHLLFKQYKTNMTSTETFNLYPHGFISEKVILPSFFCSLGLLKYQEDLRMFSIVREQIIQSLHNKASKCLTKWEVFPLKINDFTNESIETYLKTIEL